MYKYTMVVSNAVYCVLDCSVSDSYMVWPWSPSSMWARGRASRQGDV